MAAPRTALTLSFSLLSSVLFASSGLAPTAAADPDSPYCPTLTAALPDIDATYQQLKKVADEEAAADAGPAETEPAQDQEPAGGTAGGGSAGSAPIAQAAPSADEGTLLAKEIELADHLGGALNDLYHQTSETGLKRIASETRDTAGSFAGALRTKQGGSPTDDDWQADFSYSSNKLRNEMNALNHLCQTTDSQQTADGSVQPGNRRHGN